MLAADKFVVYASQLTSSHTILSGNMNMNEIRQLLEDLLVLVTNKSIMNDFEFIHFNQNHMNRGLYLSESTPLTTSPSPVAIA